MYYSYVPIEKPKTPKRPRSWQRAARANRARVVNQWKGLPSLAKRALLARAELGAMTRWVAKAKNGFKSPNEIRTHARNRLRE